jgi:hypothetical protein
MHAAWVAVLGQVKMPTAQRTGGDIVKMAHSAISEVVPEVEQFLTVDAKRVPTESLHLLRDKEGGHVLV